MFEVDALSSIYPTTEGGFSRVQRSGRAGQRRFLIAIDPNLSHFEGLSDSHNAHWTAFASISIMLTVVGRHRGAV